MKYIIILSDGMAGEPLAELGGATTMEAADKPCMDRLVRDSECGLAGMVPEGMAPGSDTANLAVMGYDPRRYYTGRSPLEALSIGAPMKDTDVSLRMNLVTLSDTPENYEDKSILDHSAGEITNDEAKVLMDDLKQQLAREGYDFYCGTSYRHLVIVDHGEITELTPPHDILERRIGDCLPADPALKDMMVRSYEILDHHPVNEDRRRRGLNPANSVWFWGAGKRPALTSFYEKTGRKGIMISAVDLLKGIAVGAGLDIAHVEGATGGLHTNYEGKAAAAVEALTDGGYDFAYIHIEAPDEMGHQGLYREKIQAIENVDRRVLKPVIKGLEEHQEAYRIMILPDHPTPVARRTHTAEPVPYMIYDSTKNTAGPDSFCERTASQSGICCRDGYRLIDHFLESE